MNLISVITKWLKNASYPTNSLDYKYSEAKLINPNTNIYFSLASNDNIGFIHENKESSESTSFLNN